MIVAFLNSLPSSLLEAGQLTSLGFLVVLITSFVGFLSIGLLAGMFVYRRFNRAVVELKKDNQKGYDRLSIYQATIEKQEISYEKLS